MLARQCTPCRAASQLGAAGAQRGMLGRADLSCGLPCSRGAPVERAWAAATCVLRRHQVRFCVASLPAACALQRSEVSRGKKVSEQYCFCASRPNWTASQWSRCTRCTQMSLCAGVGTPGHQQEFCGARRACADMCVVCAAIPGAGHCAARGWACAGCRPGALLEAFCVQGHNRACLVSKVLLLLFESVCEAPCTRRYLLSGPVSQ